MIRSEVREIENWIKEVRRDFHKYPEPRFKETRTAAEIAEHLHSIGLEVKTGVRQLSASAFSRAPGGKG